MNSFRKVLKLDPEHRGAQEMLNRLVNDQEMLYTFGIEAPKEADDTETLTSNYYIGEAYKGFAMIDKAFKHFKEQLKIKK